ncbi:hypothetical protein ACFL45_02265 [Candidatus Neomarinimicrobiota bacterium]
MRVIYIISASLVILSGLMGTTLADGSIYHQVVSEAAAQEPLTLEAVVEAEDAAVITTSIYYRVKGQTAYLEVPMSSAGGNLFFGTLPAGDITTAGLEYYIIAMLADESVLAFPVDDPEVNPLSVTVRPSMEQAMEDVFKETPTDLTSADVLILSPEPMQFYLPEDVVIGVSLFNILDLDDSSIRLFIDGQDVTSQAEVSADLVTYSPAAMGSGAHQVEVRMNRSSGAAYEPVAWRFLVTEKVSVTTERAFRQSGTITPSYNRTVVDEEILKVSSMRMSYRGGWDWLQFRGSVKLTSEEDKYKSPRNRYSAAFQTPLLKIGVGDVTPRFNRFAMDGKRLRGYDANLTLKLFNLRVAQGELDRVIQGRPDKAYGTPEYSFGDGVHQIGLSRSNYTFKRNILAIRPSFGTGQRFELVPLFVIKAKDDIASVDHLVSDGEVDIPAELGSHPAFMSEDWYGSTATHDTVIVGEDTSITTKSRVVDISRLMELAEQYGDLYVNLPESDWSGKKPEDNLVIGSSISMASKKRRFVVQSGFAFSMLNKNIWDPVLSRAGLDTLAPGDDQVDGKVMGELALESLPDPANFEDYFHMNLNQVPLVPIAIDSTSLSKPLRMLTKMPSLAYHATAKLNYLRNFITLEYQQVGPQFNSLANPNLQRNVRVRTFSDRLRLFKNKLFLTAVFRNTDDDIVKVRVDDDPNTGRDESLDSEPITTTNTVNLSANLNLGFGLPSVSIGQRTYERNNGVEDTVHTLFADEIIIRDDRENTLTTSRTFGLTYRLMLLESSHNLNLNIASTVVEDQIKQRFGDASTTAPGATSNILSLGASSRFSKRLETNFVLTTNNAEIGESGDSLYVTQDIFELNASARILLLNDKLGVRGGVRFTSNKTNQDDNPIAPPSFTQFSISGGTSYSLVENLRLVTEFQLKSKAVEIDGVATTLPSSTIAARLEYLF